MSGLFEPGRAPRTRNRVRLVLAAIGVTASLSCNAVPLTAPTNSTIVLAATSLIVQSDGWTEIIATVVESAGTFVQNGTLVTFTTTVGQIDPREARTRDGAVTVRFLGNGESGEAEIYASSGGATTTEPLRILVGAAAAFRVDLSANPASLPSGGGTAEITAVVLDTNGTPVHSIPVSFSTTAGSLSRVAGETDASGRAVTTLTTTRDATVTAVAGSGAGIAASVAVDVSVRPTLSIAGPSGTVAAGAAATFTVTATVPSGASALRDVTLSFGDGATQSLGALSGTVSVSHTYLRAGTYTVSVTGVDVDDRPVSSVSTSVTVIAPAPLEVTLTASPTAPLVDQVVTFTATVSESGGGASPQIASYRWGFGDGTVMSTNGRTTTHVYTDSGIRLVTLTVTATDGRTASAFVSVTVAPQAPLDVSLSASPTATTVGQVVNFTATVSQSGGGTTPQILEYRWDFGDRIARTTNGRTTTHVYGSAGVWTATVTVTAVDGRVASSTVEVSVGPNP